MRVRDIIRGAALMLWLALLAVTTVQARTQSSASFSVSDDGFEQISLSGDTVLWQPLLAPVSIGQCCGTISDFTMLDLAFDPADGWMIGGYTVLIEGEFISDGHVEDWGSFDTHDALNVHLSFGPADAGPWSILATPGPTDFLSLFFAAQAHATPSFCSAPASPDCGLGQEIDPKVTMKVSLVTITPHLQPVPEPQTYLLLLVGLSAIGWRALRARPKA